MSAPHYLVAFRLAWASALGLLLKKVSLWDFRGCQSDLGYERMKEIRAFVTAHYDPAWTHQHAALVTDSDLGYGLARMYGVLTEAVSIEVEVFRDMEQARA